MTANVNTWKRKNLVLLLLMAAQLFVRQRIFSRGPLEGALH